MPKRRASAEPAAPAPVKSAAKSPSAEPKPAPRVATKELPAPAPKPAPSAASPAPAKSAPAPDAASRIAAAVPAIDPNVMKLVADLAGELSTRCSFAGAGDDNAFNDCQRALSGSSKLRGSLAATALWGEAEKSAGTRLVRSGLAELSADDLAGKHLPLFMFSGRQSVSFSEPDKLFRVELGARMRNRLPPARFPDAVRQQDDAWAKVQRTTGIVLWIDPQKLTISAAQHTADSSVGNGPSEPAAKPAQ